MEHQQQAQQPNTRLMQVKVLYTFNDDSKSNCLARCPQPLPIQTARLDQNTEIGVIELRTCIQAIANTSPELVAKLGQDFTVYAYDYSEYETPLVGQGMLSWILASSSSTPTAPAHQSRTMVTGKISRNILGLFSGGSQEALEVKLRLVPVPTTLQSEYLASLEKYRSASNPPPGPQAPEPAAWQYSQTSPTIGPASPALSATGIVPPRQRNYRAASTSAIKQGGPNFDPKLNTFGSDGPGYGVQAGYGQIHSRPGTPTGQSAPIQATSRVAAPSRPSSSNSNRGRPSLKHAASSAPRMENVETSEAEDGPKRKRARVTQTDWNGSSNFGAKADSLRVTAATAASIRGRGPRGHNPLTSDIEAEMGERPPTPRPRQIQAPKPIPSFPRSLTTPANELCRLEPAKGVSDKVDPLRILEESSPEKGNGTTAGSSPVDIPSSPPVMSRESPALPSSPLLPKLPRFADSGFASGNLDEYLPEGNEGDDEADNDEVIVVKDEAGMDTTGFGRKLLPRPPASHGASGRLPNEGAIPSSPTQKKRQAPAKPRSQSTTSRRGSISQPHRPADTGHDGLNDVNVALLSAAIPGPDDRLRSESVLSDIDPQTGVSAKRQQDYATKKQAIEDRLAEAIKSGTMPRYCRNCGVIKTSSWRICYMKVTQEDVSHLQKSETTEPSLLSCEVVEKNDDGSSKSYRIIKKKVEKNEEGYETIEVCNACGIYLWRNKRMRPYEQWAKPRAVREYSKKKKSQDPPAEGSEMPGNVLGLMDEATRGSQGAERPLAPRRSPRRLQRANSMMELPTRKTMKKAQARAALERAVQSSPPRFPGSQTSPIEVDLGDDPSPKSTSRLLFPSPRKPGEMKSLDPNEDNKVSPVSSKKRKKQAGDVENEKENARPVQSDAEDDLDSLFGDQSKLLTTPKQGSQNSDPLKTPTRSIKRTPLGSQGSKSSRCLHRRHSNPETPSRAAGMDMSAFNMQMTPFSAQMSRMLSEANEDSFDLGASTGASFGMDESGMFNFSDFTNSSGTGSFALYDDSMDMSGNFWENGEMFEGGGMDAFLSGPGPTDAQANGTNGASDN